METIPNRFAEGLDGSSRLTVESPHRQLSRTPSPRRSSRRRLDRTPSPRNLETLDPLTSRVSFYMDDPVIPEGASLRRPGVHRAASCRVPSELPSDRGTRLYRHGSDVYPKRTGSRRSVRRQDSSASRRSDVGRQEALQLPTADLPPKERRRRTVVLIVIATFMFLVVCSVLVVVITLTHSSFHKNNYVPEHVRKENEEYLNSISREGTLNNVLNGSASSPPLDLSSTPQP